MWVILFFISFFHIHIQEAVQILIPYITMPFDTLHHHEPLEHRSYHIIRINP